MQIEHEPKENGGRFFIKEKASQIGELHYTMQVEDLMNIDHTEVGEAFSGRNIGQSLVEHAVDYARQHQMKVIPTCTFAKSLIGKRPDLQDVLAS